MSAAEVQFHFADDKRHWSRDRMTANAGAEQAFSFACPKHERRCGDLIIVGKTTLKRGERKDGGVPQWEWDGNRESPTFAPSVNCIGCWHGYIRAGRCVDTQDKDEPQLSKEPSP
jgi:hypothetical protein